MIRLSFMGECPPEEVRCRVFGQDAKTNHSDGEEQARIAFLRDLGTTGVLDAPAFDGWIKALSERGWVVDELEPAPGGGRFKRWRLSERGKREAMRVMQ